MGEDVVLSDAAKELKMSHVSVWRHVNSGKLPARKVGPIWLVKREDLDAFKATRRRVGRPRKSEPMLYPMVGDHATGRLRAAE